MGPKKGQQSGHIPLGVVENALGVLGVGNGDPNGHHDDKASAIRLFGGMAQVITPRTGEVTLSYKGVASVTVKEEL